MTAENRPGGRVADLGTAPVGRLYLRLALPAVTAQLVNALYSIVDRIFIGHIPQVGELALTGVGLTFPIVMLISALACLVGMGGGSQASIRMGEGDFDRAERLLGSCVFLLLVLAAAATVVFEWLRVPLLYLFGASDATVGYASDYLSLYLLGTVFTLAATGLNNFITIQGFSSVSMATTLIGAALNLVLDPIFIFALGMGVKGAALATVIAQGVSALWVGRFLTGARTRLTIRPAFLRPDWRILAPALAIGFSPFVMQATESLLNIAFNSSLQRYGGDIAVGAMTVASSLMNVFGILSSGLAQGAQPIIGYNFGAGNLARVRRAFRLLFVCALSLSTAAWLVSECCPGLLVAAFTDSAALRDYAPPLLRLYMGSYFLLGIQHSCQQTFVALGQAKISVFLALLRKCILLIPLIFILPCFLGDKVFAVFLAEPAADCLAALTTGTLFFARFPKILARRKAELEEAHS